MLAQLSLWRVQREVLRAVKADGWTTVPVEGPEIAWTYSVGLLDHGLPELIVFGRPGDLGAKVIYQAQPRIRDGRFKPFDGMAWVEPGSDWQVRWRRVHDSQYLGFDWLRMTKWYHQRRTGRREPIEAYQLVLPDADRRYPWEDGFDERMRHAQPELYLPLDAERMLASYDDV